VTEKQFERAKWWAEKKIPKGEGPDLEFLKIKHDIQVYSFLIGYTCAVKDANVLEDALIDAINTEAAAYGKHFNRENCVYAKALKLWRGEE